METVPATIEQAVKGPQLSAIKKTDEALLDLALMRLLQDLCMLCDVQWSENMILMAIENIKARYWSYKLDEVAMILHNGSMGAYGKLYGSLKILDLLNWFKQYDEDKAVYCETESLKHKEINDNYFRELEKKEQIKQRAITQDLVMKYQASKDAKRKIDGE